VLFELFTVQSQELSRFFETPEYLNMATVHHLVHPCDSIVDIRFDYNRASRPLGEWISTCRLLHIGITKIYGRPAAHFEKFVKCRVKRWIISQRVTEGYEIA
jgi:hypothetical protein